MTTNVIDIFKKLVYTDSRWTLSAPQFDDLYHIYVDKTGYKKLIVSGSFIFVFSGDINLIEIWKNWAREKGWERQELPTIPRDNSQEQIIQVHQVNWITQSIHRVYGKCITYDCMENLAIPTRKISFAGSGARYAMEKRKKTMDYRTILDYCKRMDPFTGGDPDMIDLRELKTIAENNDVIKFNTKYKNDLSPNIEDSVMECGFFKDKKTGKVVSIQDSFLAGGIGKDIYEHIKGGFATLTAVPLEYRAWTEEEVEDFKLNMEEMREIDKKNRELGLLPDFF